MLKPIGEFPKEWNAEEILNAVLKHYVGVLNSSELRAIDSWWGTKQAPEVVVFCTNSTRKAIMFALLAKMYEDVRSGKKINIEEYFPHSVEKKLNKWFAENVSNGDGSLKLGKPHFIGFFAGVQLWIQPTKGESSKNDQPAVEADSKAQHGRMEWLENAPDEVKNKRTIFVGADTVEHVQLPDGKLKTHGKPVNLENYPQQQTDESPQDFEKRIQEFNKLYISEGYPLGAEVEHLVAVAFFALSSGTLESNKVESGIISTKYMVAQGMMDNVVIDPEAGGGGITQQLEKIYKGLNPEERIAMLCQIMGVPLLPILEMIKNAVPEKPQVLQQNSIINLAKKAIAFLHIRDILSSVKKW